MSRKRNSTDYERLFNISEKLRSILAEITLEYDLSALLLKIVQSGIELMEMDSGAVLLYDPHKKRFTLTSALNIPAPYKGRILDLKKGIIRQILEEKKVIILPDLSEHPEWKEELGIAGYSTVMATPILWKDEIIGIIYLGSKSPKKIFFIERKRILESLAQYAAVAINNIQLIENINKDQKILEQRTEELEKSVEQLEKTKKAMLNIMEDMNETNVQLKQAHQKLQEWSKTLEKKVEERTEKLQKQLERTKALEKIASQISTELDLSRSLPLIGEESAKILNADRWAILFMDELTKEPKFIYSEGLSREYKKAAIEHYKELPGGKVNQSQKPIFIPDVSQISSPLKELAAREGYRSVNIIPSNYRGEIVGGIIYYHDKKKGYSELEKELAMAFGNQIAVAIANSRLFEKQKETIKQLKAINEMGRSVISYLDKKKLLSQATKLVENITKYPFVFALLVDKESNELVQVAKAGRLQNKIPSKYKQKITEGMIGRAAVTGEIQISGNVSTNSHYLKWFPEVNSEISVPIKTRDGEVIGVLDAQSDKFNAFREDDIATIQTIADQISVALENLELYKNLERRVNELSSLYSTGQSITETLDLDDVLNQILVNLRRLIPSYLAAILLFNPSLNELSIQAFSGPQIDSLKEAHIKPGQGVTGAVFQTRKSVIVSDVRKEPKYIMGHPDIRSEIAVPLIYRDEILGVLNAESKEINAYNEDHLRIMNYFANQAAIAIRNAQLFKETKRKAEEMKVLYEIGVVSLSTLELDKLLKLISEKVMKLFNVSTFYLSLYHEEKGEISFPVLIDEGKTIHISPWKLSDTKGLTNWIIKFKKPLLIKDYDEEKESLPTEVVTIGIPAKSYIGIPLIVKEKVIGVISVQGYQKRMFNEEHENLLTSIANQVALTIDNARLFKESKDRAERLLTISQITRAFSSTLNTESIFDILVDQIKRIIPFDSIGIYRYDEKNQFFKVVGVKGIGKELFPDSLEFSMEHSGIESEVVKSMKPILMKEIKEKSKLKPMLKIVFKLGIRSFLALPIIYENKCIAVLSLASTQKNIYNVEHIKILNELVGNLAISLKNAEYYQELKNAYSKLKETQKQLVMTEKLRALGEISGGVAHDFNNILGAILGRAQLLRQKLADPEMSKGLEIIEKAAVDGAEIVRRIQEFTRTRAEKFLGEVDLNQVVEESLALTRSKWKNEVEAKGIKIVINKNLGEVPPVAGNPAELKEALTNIILNSIDALPQGGEISISTFSEEDKARLEITDNGIGMPPEVKERAFDPFFSTKGVQGTGLGLSVVYGIITRHQGEIELESEEKKGTTISILLPKVKKKRRRVKEKPLSTKKEKTDLDVLVIDDDENIRLLLADILKPHGHRVTLAGSGQEGIEAFKKGKFDLVLTDIGMPEISGWEVAKKIKSISPQIVIGFITGWAMQLNEEELDRAGISLVITKPFKIEKILEVISQVSSQER
ncbi:MAG: GAF domain-containing protein [Candidatus Aminicenantia bacterium]